MVGPNVVLEWTVATADMELRGAARNLRLSGLAGVKGHHNRSREAPNPRERRTLRYLTLIKGLRVRRVATIMCVTRGYFMLWPIHPSL